MDRHEEIKASYKSLGKGFANMYDGIITRSTLLGKLMDRKAYRILFQNSGFHRSSGRDLSVCKMRKRYVAESC